MKNSITILSLLFLVSFQTMKAQDILELSDGARIEIKIIKETEEGIKYTRYNTEKSDTLTIKSGDISYRRTLKDHKEIVLNAFAKVIPDSNINIIKTNKQDTDSIPRYSLPDRRHLSFGYGVLMEEALKFNGIDNTNKPVNFTGPFYIKYEYAILDYIGLGINCAYGVFTYNNSSNYFSNSTANNGYYYNTEYTSYSILLHLNYHFLSRKINTHFDSYFGTGMGYKSIKKSISTNDTLFQNQNTNSSSPSFGFDMNYGIRYYISNMIALYAEAGIAKSWFQFGATFKF